MSYKIVRKFARSHEAAEVIKRGLTLKQAQKHCGDPETSSETCQEPENQAIEVKHGPWFDCYYQE